jgi:hypothetical protein
MSMQQTTLAQHRLAHPGLLHNAMRHSTVAGSQAALPGSGGAGLGSGALARAVERWRRAMLHDHAQTATSSPTPGVAGPTPASAPATSPASPSASADDLAALVRRLDDSGCSYGRVSAARLDAVTRAYDRLETKMNAVLMAVTGTFLSTLAGLLLYYVRGGGQ